MSDQPSTIDLVSAVGTWLAAGLAVIALVGVVGPILVWRATKSEHNRATNALEEAGAETYGYVSHGVWTGRQVRLFRRINAPLLEGEPDLGGRLKFDFGFVSTEKQKHKDVRPQPSPQSADWVQFGSLIETYGIPMQTGGGLVIRDGRAWLSVDTSWLLLTGILGRYGPWQDKGRLPPSIARGIASTQAKVGTPRVPQRSLSRASSRSRHGVKLERERERPGWETGVPWHKSNMPWQDERDYRSMEQITYRPLYGLNGTLYTPSRGPDDGTEKTRVFFERHKVDWTGHIASDSYGVDLLFWMAVGCLPARNATILCLADVQDVEVIPEPSAAVQRTQSPSPFTPAAPPLQHGRVHFDNFDELDSESEDSYARRGGYRVSHGPSRPNPTPAMFVSPQSGDASASLSYDPSRPRAFELAEWNERNNALSDFAAVVHADVASIKVLSFREIALSEDQMQDILDIRVSCNPATGLTADVKPL
ncbi:hypothetical protein B0I35DRAFT_484832 [Stachybotrys elegans]|uniref:Uncharacterized protein n=1 Tax=Stachybotrys elegans TaxID=80388 RepID=A0A8K0SGY5_9HYPO|nr:hypothetical protein B0I35DRAFT_484832 [Stachybotrys elegans]